MPATESSESAQIAPFTIDVPDQVLTDLGERLARARWPDAIPESGWEYGVALDYLRNLAAYWHKDFDWRRQERELNKLSHFRTDIDGATIHFVHLRSKHSAATPLILVHGWPGSFVEFLDVAAPLIAPEEHGGQAADAFHLVIPSLPGYGFSGPTRARGWNPRRAGAAYVELMRRLGYERYVVQGGDWGAFVVDEMALADPARIIGLHTNLPIAGPPPDPQESPSAEVQADLAAMARWHSEESAYALLQGTKPQTIGVALNDSPVGLLGWMVEKFQSWSDNGLDRTIGRDRLLTNVTLYWITQTATSAARFYYEFYRTGAVQFDAAMWSKLPGPITVPTAVARYPKEAIRIPRQWLERRYSLVQWTDMPRGGHFAAMEEPHLFVDDLRAFLKILRLTQ
jgi:epoxide hydrolase